jgi:hypothetical protein
MKQQQEGALHRPRRESSEDINLARWPRTSSHFFQKLEKITLCCVNHPRLWSFVLAALVESYKREPGRQCWVKQG